MISHRNMSKSRKFETQLYDPHISWIEKNIAKNRPKFLDLYASIYGSCLMVMSSSLKGRAVSKGRIFILKASKSNLFQINLVLKYYSFFPELSTISRQETRNVWPFVRRGKSRLEGKYATLPESFWRWKTIGRKILQRKSK
jgi:hypothetical protein